MRLSRFGYATCVVMLHLATTNCSSDSAPDTTEDRDGAPKSDGATSKPDVDGSSYDGAETGMPPTSVTFTVPVSGGSVDVGTPSGNRLTLSFPLSAAGKTIVLTASDPASIGFTNSDFDEVIRMDPDGTQFAEPVVVRSSQGVMLAVVPSNASRTAPEWLPLSPDGKGAELRHFSSLGVAHAGCPFTEQTNAPACAQIFPGGGTQLTMTCALPQLCSSVTVTCCADPMSGDKACRFGAAALRFATTGIPGPSYCPSADGGRGDGSTDANALDATADHASIDASTTDAAVSDASTDTSVTDASTDASGADAVTADNATGTDADATDVSTDTGTADATMADASTGADTDAPSGDATGDSTSAADAFADSGVNGTCGSGSYSAGDAGASSCLVNRSDGTATLWMVCDGSSCHCYINDTSHPYGSPFDVGNSPCLNSQLALQQMIAFCGCP